MGLAKKIEEIILWRGLYVVSVFIINLLMARLLGAGPSGNFYILLNNLSFIILIVGFCVESAIVYFGASERIKFKKLATFSLIWSVSAWVVSCIILLFCWPALMKEYNLLWLSGYIFSFLLINNSTALFQVQHNFTLYSFLLLLMNVLLIFFLIIVLSGIFSKGVISESVIEDDLSSNYSIGANFIVVFIQAILLVGFSWRNIKRPWFQLPDFFEVRLLLKYAVLSFGTNIVFFLVYRVDYWFISYFWQDKDLGNYIQVSKLVQIFMVFPTFLGTIIFPTSAKGDVVQLNEKLAALSRVIFTSYLIILTILFVIGKVLFPFLYGESFSGMYLPFILLIPGILALSIHSLITAYYAGKNKVIVNFKGALLALLFILVIDYLLIPIFGNSGAAIASSVGYMVYAIFMFYIFHKDQHLSFLQFLLIKKGDWHWLKQRIINNNGT